MKSLITENLPVWTTAPNGIKKLRELILELAVRGLLVPQDPHDEPVSVLLEKIAAEKTRLVSEGKIKPSKPLPKISETEKPFVLPKGWEWTRWDNVAMKIGDIDHKMPEQTFEGIPYVSPRDFFANNVIDFDGAKKISYEDFLKLSEKIQPQRGDIIYPRYGTIGENCLVETDREFLASYSCCVIKTLHGFISPKYQFIFSISTLTKNQAKKAENKTTQANVGIKSIQQYLFPLPPLAEQHRIVAKVDELMQLCDQLEQKQSDSQQTHRQLVSTLLTTLTEAHDAQAFQAAWSRIAANFDALFTTLSSVEQLQQTILQLAVMGKLVPQNPDDEPACELLKKIAEEKARLIAEGKIRKQNPLPKINESEKPFNLPESWEWVRFDNIVNITSGITKGRRLIDRKVISVPYLRVANVQRGFLNLDEIKNIDIPEEELAKFQIFERDLLITEGGDWDKVGRTAVWRTELPLITHQNHVFKARLILVEQNEIWFEKYLNSYIARNYFANSSKQTTNLASINKTQLSNCLVPIPPLAEQHRIVAKVDELMTLCEHLKTKLQSAQTLQQQLAQTLVQQAVA